MILAPAARAAAGQPGDLETAVGIVDGVVRHQHLGRPGLEAQAGHRRQRFRMGGGPQGGRGGEGGVDLDEHPVALADEGLHPSQGLNPPLDHERPVRAPNYGHFPRPRSHGGEGVIPQTGQRLPALDRDGAFGVIQGQAQAAGGQGQGRGIPHPLEEIPAVQLGGFWFGVP